MRPTMENLLRSFKHPVMAMASLSVAGLACSLLNRAETTGPGATETSPQAPTSPPALAAEVLQQLAPPSLAGVELESLSLTGADLDAADPPVAEFLASLGTDPSEFKVSVVLAPADSPVSFQAGAITIPGKDWNAALAGAAAASTEDGGVQFEVVPVGGRSVMRATSTNDAGELLATYYAVEADTLYYVHSNDGQTAEAATSTLPDRARYLAPVEYGPRPGDSIVLGDVLVFTAQTPTPPVCVGDGTGRHWFAAMAVDQLGSPMPSAIGAVWLALGDLMMPPAEGGGGPLFSFQYRAIRYDPRGELLRITMSAPTAYYPFELRFPVRHCLAGAWNDEDRTLEITSSGSTNHIARVTSGTLCDEQGVVAFSGELIEDHITGSDMMVCEPEECVEAGLLPKTRLVEFTGRVAEDSMSIEFQWPNISYDLQYDDGGNLTACPVSGGESRTFTITRLGIVTGP